MSTAIEITNCLIEMAIFLFFCTQMLTKRKLSPLVHYGTLMGIFILHVCRSFLIHSTYMNYHITIIMWGTLIFALFKDSVIKKCVLLLTYIFVLISTDIIARSIISFMFEISNSPMNNYQGPMRYIGMSIVNISMLTIFALFIAFARSRMAPVDLKYWVIMLLFPIFTLFIIVCCDIFLIISGTSDIHHVALISAITITLVIFNFLIFEFMKSYSAQIQLNSAKLLITQQEENYTNIQISENELSKLRHDILNHVRTMETMLASGNTRDAEKLLDDLKNSSVLTNNLTYTNDSAIDAILNLNARKASNSSVEYIVKTNNMTCPINIPPLDKSTILSNALTNALEGCSKVSEKFIVVTIASNEKNFTIAVENSSLPIKKTNGIFPTSKSDLKHHGYGILNMEETVKKHGGNLTLSHSDGVTTLSIVAPNTKE